MLDPVQAYCVTWLHGHVTEPLILCRHTAPYSLLANGLLMCRFAAPLAFNFMAAVAIPPSSRHSQGDRDVQDTVSFFHLCSC